MLKIMGARFLTVREISKKVETRMKSVMWDWKCQYQCEFMDFNI